MIKRLASSLPALLCSAVLLALVITGLLSSVAPAADLIPAPSNLVGFGGRVGLNSDGSIQLQTATGQPIQAFGSSAGFYSGPIVFGSLSAPAVSASAQANLYFDGTALKLSTNGGGYITIGAPDLHSPGAIGDVTPATEIRASAFYFSLDNSTALVPVFGGVGFDGGGGGLNAYIHRGAAGGSIAGIAMQYQRALTWYTGGDVGSTDTALVRPAPSTLALRYGTADQRLILGAASGTGGGVLEINTIASAPSNVSGHGMMFVLGGEVNVMDDSGNITVISPHAHDAPPWLYEAGAGADNMERKINVFLAEVRWKNVDRLQRVLELDAIARLDAANAAAAWDEVFARQKSNRFATTALETFAAYETRTGRSLVPSDQPHDDWLALTPAQRWQKVEADRMAKSQADHDAWAARKAAAAPSPSRGFTEAEPAIYVPQPVPAFLLSASVHFSADDLALAA